MPKNKIQDLRNHLFSALEGLTNPDPENPMDIERAKAIADVSQVLVNTIKVENDFLRITGNARSTAFDDEPKKLT